MSNNQIERLQLDAILTEYESVRKEKIRRIELQIKLIEGYLLGLAAVYAGIIQYKFWEILPIVGFTASVITLFWTERQRVIQTLRDYIQYEIEAKKIPMLLGSLGEKEALLNWQHFYSKNFLKISSRLYYLIFVPLFASAIVVPLLFCYYVFFKENYNALGFSTEFVNALNWWHVSLLRKWICLFFGTFMILFGIISILVPFHYRLVVLAPRRRNE